jgi:hypothetical protein
MKTTEARDASRWRGSPSRSSTHRGERAKLGARYDRPVELPPFAVARGEQQGEARRHEQEAADIRNVEEANDERWPRGEGCRGIAEDPAIDSGQPRFDLRHR